METNDRNSGARRQNFNGTGQRLAQIFKFMVDGIICFDSYGRDSDSGKQYFDSDAYEKND